MDVSQLESNIEFLSEQVHNAWWEEKKRRGFHAPNECPDFEPEKQEFLITQKFTKHCDHCHTDMYKYSELPENIKEYDRVTVQTVLEAIKKVDKPKQYTCENCGNRYTGFCDNCTTLNIAGSLPSNFCPKEVTNANKRAD
jgi:hypothetical protein